MCYRWTIFACDGSYPLRLKGETNNDFDRICVGAIVEAIREIGYSGFANLEADAHADTGVEADMRRNLAFIRRIVNQY